MKNIPFILCLFVSLYTFAQEKTLTAEDLKKELNSIQSSILSLKSANSSLKSDITDLNKKLKAANDSILILSGRIENNISAIAQTENQLGIKITSTEDTANKRIADIDNSLNKTILFSIIAVLSAILLSGLLYRLLSKRQKTDKTQVEKLIEITKKSIVEEQIQINTKLAELYYGQMELLKQERKTNPSTEIDHSLALKVADEIVKMQMNLIHMDNKVRGHKQLTIAVTNVFDNFKANGYDIIDHLNKPYKDGMNMQATMEPDPTLLEGEQIIRRIIKPEIHFNNKIIQHAQVIVAYGE